MKTSSRKFGGYIELPFYDKIAVSSVLIMLFSGFAKETGLFSNVYKVLMVDGIPYQYYYWELVNFIGQLIAQLLMAIAIRHYTRHRKIPRCVLQWCIDMIIVDIAFVILRNPFELDKAKAVSFMISTIMFALIFIFEEILTLRVPNPFIKNNKHEKSSNGFSSIIPIGSGKRAIKK